MQAASSHFLSFHKFDPLPIEVVRVVIVIAEVHIIVAWFGRRSRGSPSAVGAAAFPGGWGWVSQYAR